MTETPEQIRLFLARVDKVSSMTLQELNDFIRDMPYTLSEEEAAPIGYAVDRRSCTLRMESALARIIKVVQG